MKKTKPRNKAKTPAPTPRLPASPRRRVAASSLRQENATLRARLAAAEARLGRLPQNQADQDLLAELRHQQAALNASHQRMLDILESIGDGFFSLDRQWRVTYVNEKGAHLLAKGRDSMLGRNLWELFPEAVGSRFQEAYERALADQVSTSVESYYPPLEAWFEARAYPAPEGLSVFYQNITERKQAEDTLRFLVQCGATPGQDFFQALARHLAQSLGMDYVCIDRLQAGLLSAQTVAVFHNGVFEDNVAYTLKDTPCGAVVGQAICCFPTGVRHLFPTDEVLQTLRAESYVGATLWSSQGQPIGLIALIGRQPLTDSRLAESILQLVAARAAGELERRQAEAALRELTQRLTYHVDNSPLAVIEWGADLRLRRWSGEAERLFGWTAEEVLGKRIEDFRWIYEPDKPQGLKASIGLQDSTTPRRFSANRAYRKDGQVVDCEWYNSSLLDASGKLRSILSLVLDVTARNQAEATMQRAGKAIQALNAKLEQRVRRRTAELGATVARLKREARKRQQAARKLNQANARLQERSNLLRALVLELSQVEERERRRVAHVLHEELQQLLVSIRLHTEFVAARASTPPLRTAGAKATHIVEEALTVTSTLTSELFPPVLHHASFGTALRWLGRWMHHRHRLTVRVRAPATLATLARDFRGLLFQCVRELLFNVVKHARVTLATVQVCQRARLLQIVVTDRGAGFTPAKSRAQPVRGGLGLHGIRERIDALGGQMEVQSAPGKGTTVTLRLPCLARPASPRAGSARKPGP